MIVNVRTLEEKIEKGLVEGRALENAKTTLDKIKHKELRPDVWMLENNEGTYGIDVIIRKDGFIDICLCILQKYSSRTSYVRVGHFQPEFGLGDAYFADGKEKEYKKLGNIINAISKEYEKYGLYIDTKNNREILKQARLAYELDKKENEVVVEDVVPEPEKKSGFEVRIVNISTGEVVQTMDAPNMRMAEKIERGVLINLNTDDYYVEIVDMTQSKKPEEKTEVETVTEKMEEKEMNTINKNGLNNRMMKLGEFLKENRDKDAIENKVFDLFPKAMEVQIFNEDNTIYFLVGQDYVGKVPTKKEMKEIDYMFDRVDKMYGLSVYVDIQTEKIKMDATIGIDYSTKHDHSEFTDYTVKEIELELDLTMEIAQEVAKSIRKKHDEEKISATVAWDRIRNLTQRETSDEVLDFLVEELTYYAHKEKEEILEKNTNKIEVKICEIDLQVQKGVICKSKAEEKLEELYKYASTQELEELVHLAIKYVAVPKEENIEPPQKIKELLNRRYSGVIEKKTKPLEKIVGTETREQAETILRSAYKNCFMKWDNELGFCIESKILDCYRGRVHDIPADAKQILRGGEVYAGVEFIKGTNEMIVYIKTRVEYLDTNDVLRTYIAYLYYIETRTNPEPEKYELENNIKEHLHGVFDLVTKKNDGVGYMYKKTVAVKKESGYELTSLFEDMWTGMDVYVGNSSNMIMTPNSEKSFLTDIIEDMMCNKLGVNEGIENIKRKIKRKFEYSYSKSVSIIEPDETKVYVLITGSDTEVFWNYEDAYNKMVKDAKEVADEWSYGHKLVIEDYSAKVDVFSWTILEKIVQ